MRLRAHHLLCLQGFRGMGYSPEFVEALSAVFQRLRREPDTSVSLVDHADPVCAACPHLNTEGTDCSLGAGPGDKDRAVLAALGMPAGETLPWSDCLRRLAAAFDGAAHEQTCGRCRWYPLGYCAAGLDALRRRFEVG